MITENEESAKSLTEQYRNGEITKDEYMSQLKELHHQQIQLKKSYDEEKNFFATLISKKGKGV